MNETVHRFGAHGGIVGVLARAGGDSEELVIFLNAGMLPRTGPHRLHVFCGRRLGLAGRDHLRLDQAQIGDARARTQPDDPLERAFLDLRETLDALEREQGYRRFVLFGLCAGAQVGLLYAAQDPRVSGLVLIDGPAYPTRSYFLQKVRNLFNLRRGRNILRRLGTRIFRPTPYSPHLANPPGWELPREQAQTALAQGLARGVRYLWVYTGDSPAAFLTPRQFGEFFPRIAGHPGVTLEWRPRATHLLSYREDRQDICSTLERWLAKPAGSPDPTD